MNHIQRQGNAHQSEVIARQSLAAQTDQMVVASWMHTNGLEPTRPVTILRGWLMDELERRMNALDKARKNMGIARFDRWMTAECSAAKDAVVSPGTYLI